MDWEEWLKTPGKDYPCPCCFAEFDSLQDKQDHLLADHGYETLKTEAKT